MMDRDLFERIEAYLTGRMEESAMQKFEKEMERHPELREEVKIFEDVILGVQAREIRTTLDQLHSGERRFKVFRRITPIALAASMLLLVSLGIWLLLPSGSDTANLFAEFYEPDPGLPSLMGAGETLMDDAMIDYKLGDYEMAIQKMVNLEQQGYSSDTLSFYLGLSYIGAGRHLESVTRLQKIPSSDNVIGQKRNWYLALGFLKTGRESEAMELLNSIASDSIHMFRNEALQLLDKLNRE